MSTSKKYQCEECGAKGVRLWRDYGMFLSSISLECRACAMKSQNKTEADLNKYGPSDQIGWRVPAVPDKLPGPDMKLPKGYTFWGYTSVPVEGVKWWKALPVSL